MAVLMAAAPAALLSLAFPLLSSADVVYVDLHAPGPAQDGTSWDTAFICIQSGIDAAGPGDEVWVADGAYVENVVMAEGVALYGGFLGAEPGGYETSLAQRDFVNHVATIDGNQAGSCVVMARSAMVDGLTLTNGTGTWMDELSSWEGGGVFCRSLDDDTPQSTAIRNNVIDANHAYVGGGISCYCSSPIITDNTITTNWAISGGAVSCRHSSPIIANNAIRAHTGSAIFCVDFSSPPIINNDIGDTWGSAVYCSDHSSPAIAKNHISGSSGGLGGAVGCWGGSTPLIADNTISDNGAERGGAVFCFSSSPTIVGNTMSDNHAKQGGVAYCYASSPLITRNTIAGNWVGLHGQGGVVYCSYSSPIITGNTITGNTASRGGVVCCDQSSPTIVDNLMADNTADRGGILCCDCSSPVILNNAVTWSSAKTAGVVVDCTSSTAVVVDNVVGVDAAGGSEGACLFSGSSLILDGNTFSGVQVSCSYSSATLANNVVYRGAGSGTGWAVRCDHSSATIRGNTIRDSSASGGGAVYCVDSLCTIADNAMAFTPAEPRSSALRLRESEVSITGNSITGKSAKNGGAIYCEHTSATISNNTLSGNTASSAGGAILFELSEAEVTGNRISGNTAGEWGGAIFCVGCSPTITGNTIVGNSSGEGGGIYFWYSPSPSVSNNIIAGNSANGAGGGIWCDDQSQPSLAFNAFWENAPDDCFGCSQGPGDISADPRLADPDNGDYHLMAGSPCIDAGDNGARGLGYEDFEGDPRVCDGDGDGVAIVDIGADEYRSEYEANAAPQVWFEPGWVWFSIPLIPRWHADANDVLGFDCTNRLYAWNAIVKDLRFYPYDFRDLAVGNGYLLRLDVGEHHRPVYEGAQPLLPFEWDIPAAGWSWIGVPATQDIHGLDLTVAKGGEVRSPADDLASADPWLNWNWVYWDPVKRACKLMNPFGAGDDAWLHPWWGYRLWSNTEGVRITFP